jgi:hypothetical protein
MIVGLAQKSDPMLHLKLLEKQEQAKPKTSGRQIKKNNNKGQN